MRPSHTGLTIPVQNAASSRRRSPTQCRTMALDIVKLYMSLLSEFFMFSDMAVMMSPNASSSGTPALLPRDSNALTTLHHLTRILGEIQDSVNEINGMDISSEASASLKALLESARWKFEDILIQSWLRGAFSPGLPARCMLTAPQMRTSSTTWRLGEARLLSLARLCTCRKSSYSSVISRSERSSSPLELTCRQA